MILHVPNVLNEQQVAHCRDVIQHATWVDGRVTAGYQSASVKDNRQLPEDSKEAHELGDIIVAALERHPMFISAVLPLRVFPPLFNRYDPGMSFGSHLDNSIRQITGTPYRVRIRPPCFAIMQGLGPLITGVMIPDVVPTFGSLNMIGGECDH